MNSNDCINCGLPIDPKCCCTNGRALAALTPSPTPTAPQEADALREAPDDTMLLDWLEQTKHFPTMCWNMKGGFEGFTFRAHCRGDKYLRFRDAIRAEVAQHQPQQGEGA